MYIFHFINLLWDKAPTAVIAGGFTILTTLVSGYFALLICRINNKQTQEKFKKEVLDTYRDFVMTYHSFFFQESVILQDDIAWKEYCRLKKSVISEMFAYSRYFSLLWNDTELGILCDELLRYLVLKSSNDIIRDVDKGILGEKETALELKNDFKKVELQKTDEEIFKEIEERIRFHLKMKLPSKK